MFGYTKERRQERQLIADYERLVGEIVAALTPDNHEIAVALAKLPERIKGFGHVKEANITSAKLEEATLLAALRDPARTKVAAQ